MSMSLGILFLPKERNESRGIFGFPPRIWGIKKGETIYSINAIPFGGFVKILGEGGEQADNPRSFSSKPAGPRLKVIIAGVTMNFFLAVVLLMITNFFGLRIGLIDDKTASIARDKAVQIIEVSKDSPADKAGIKLLDEVNGFKLNGTFKAISVRKMSKLLYAKILASP